MAIFDIGLFTAVFIRVLIPKVDIWRSGKPEVISQTAYEVGKKF